MPNTQKINTHDVFINETVGANKPVDLSQNDENQNNKSKKYAHSGTPVTQEEFLERVHKANKDLLVLDKYVNAKTKVRCKCARCGEEWESYPDVLYKTRQCKKCGEFYQQHRDSFLEKFAQKHPSVKLLSEYVNSTTKVLCRCNICGFEWKAVPNRLVIGKSGCRRCEGTLPWTKDEIIAKLANICPSVEMVGEYKNTQVPVECHCKTCGTHWNVRPSQLMQNRGCPECGKKKIGDALRKPHDVFVKEMAELMPTLTITGTYKNCAIKIACHCNVCGYDFEALPTNLRKKEGCRQCGLKKLSEINRKTHEQFISEMAVANNRVRIIGEYQGDAVKIECECLQCSRRFSSLPSNLLKGHGCKYCARTQTSFMERAILLALERSLGNYVLPRDKSAIGKELDIYIPSPLNVAIEPGSWAWHQHRIKQDTERYNLCKQKGIRLIIIFDSFDGDRSALEFDNEDLWTYAINLGDRNKKSELLNCIKRIFETLELPYNLSEEDEDALLTEAKLSVSRRKTVDVKQELAEINKNIELLSHYEDTKTKMKCRCNVCGNIFESNYDHLIRRKQGCPKCNSPKKQVVNIDTGEVFESIVAASKHIGLTDSAIGHACRGNMRKCNGHRWAYIQDLTHSQLEELRTKFPNTFTY